MIGTLSIDDDDDDELHDLVSKAAKTNLNRILEAAVAAVTPNKEESLDLDLDFDPEEEEEVAMAALSVVSALSQVDTYLDLFP